MKRWRKYGIAAVCMAFSALQVQAEENVDIAAPEAILIDRASGNVLYEKNSSTRRDPASLTKLMGLYIATMKLKDDMSITMSDAAYETYDHSSGVLWIQKEETLTVKDAEYASMLMSANDTMAMLAQAVGGDQDSFVAMMNRMAADLQMNDSHFNNIFGLYQEENYASAADLATLTRKALQQPTFAQLFGSSSYTLSATNKNSQERVLPNDCQLLRSGAYQYDGITGGKIGSTTEGGYAISASAARNGTELIAVVMGEENAENAYADVAKLFDYGFRTYQTVTISKDMIKPITVEVKEGRKHIADVIFSADGDFSLLLKGNVQTDTLTAEIQVENGDSSDPQQINGKIIFSLDGKVIGEQTAHKEIKEKTTPAAKSVLGSNRIWMYYQYMCIGLLILMSGLPLLRWLLRILRPMKE